MGIDAFLLASSLRCVIGQRLVRLLCPHCKVETEPEPELSLFLKKGARMPEGGLRQWREVGCNRCFGTGFADRQAISEVLDVDDEMRALIKPDADLAAIELAARAKGMTAMLIDGFNKCQAGLTTPAEIRRVALDI
jgi:general secretion pathway protein E